MEQNPETALEQAERELLEELVAERRAEAEAEAAAEAVDEAVAEAAEAVEEAAAVAEAEAAQTETQTVDLPLRVYLASASPRRRELLEEAGVRFTVRVPATPVDETLTDEQLADPFTAVRTLAERKAAALVQELLAEDLAPAAYVIIGADTLVVKGARIFGKPKSATDATQMLLALSGCTHQVMTGVSVWMMLVPEPGQVSVGFRSFTDESQVTFRTLHEDEILAYLRTGESFDKAGAYAIQGEGRRFVKRVQGAMDTVIGLPVERLLREFPELAGQSA